MNDGSLIIPFSEDNRTNPAQGGAREPHLAFSCRFARHYALVGGDLDYAISSKDQISINGMHAKKPYMGCVLDEPRAKWTVLLLAFDPLTTLGDIGEVTIAQGDARYAWAAPKAASPSALLDAIQSLTPPGARRLLFALYNFVCAHPELVGDPQFIALAYQLRRRVAEEGGVLDHASWIFTDLLYGELILPAGALPEARLMLQTPKSFGVWEVRLHPVDSEEKDGRQRAVALLDSGNALAEVMAGAEVTLCCEQYIVPLAGTLPHAVPKANPLLARLKHAPLLLKARLRDVLAQALLAHKDAASSARRDLLYALQHYVVLPYTSVADPALPFGMNVEYAFAVDDHVLVSGWMRDPDRLCEQAEMIADLGQRFDLLPHLHRYPRRDVEELYAASPYKGAAGDWGFIAAIPLPDAATQRMQGKAEWFSFRFEIELKGGIRYMIAPQAVAADPFSRRDALVNHIAPHALHRGGVEEIVRLAAFKLQADCMEDVAVKSLHAIGAPVKNPPVSVVIPLYRNLEFIKPQLAQFGGDPYMKRCEILYVLDSPEQEEEVRRLLEEMSKLYGVALTLLVMNRNGGYASATNAGVAASRAKLALLMNSDVIPAAPGWLKKLAAHHAASLKAGAVAPKLLYADESLQHAGMFFALHASHGRSLYHNDHYYKGYAADYAPACESRAVPAVSGACLLVSRPWFDKVGGLDTGYIIGDFEDSDFCLKLSALRRVHYYAADVALYHLERQSIPLHEQYHKDALFAFNAARHHKKWQADIALLLRNYG